VSVQREGAITQGGQRPLGLVYPAVAVAPSGQLLVVFSYAGPGNATAGIPAYPGEVHTAAATAHEHLGISPSAVCTAIEHA
jgi:hypothetical protein